MDRRESIFETRDGRQVRVRQVAPDDAPALAAHVEALAAEAPYIGMTLGEHPSAAKIADRIREIDERPGSLALLGEEVGREGLVIGDCWMFTLPRLKMRHVAQIGMSIASGWRAQGIGRAMLERVIEHGRAHPEVLRIELDALHENEAAIGLYESVGFVREGRRRGRFRQLDGTLLDDVNMGMWVGPERG